MTDREMIEQMVEDINSMSERNAHYYEKENGKLVQREAFADCKAIAEELVKKGWVKLPVGAVVLTRKKYEDLKDNESLLSKLALITREEFEELLDSVRYAHKKTARDILNDLYHREEIGFETIKWYAKTYWGIEIKE